MRTFFVGRAIGLIAVLILAGIAFVFYKGTRQPTEKEIVVIEQDKPQGELLEGGEADPSRMTLGMTTWTWISARYNDGREIKPNQTGKFTLTFKDGKFSGTTDCNSLSGAYTTEANKIIFSQIASTKMYCAGSEESEFLSFLSNAAGYHFTTRGELILDLKFDSGSVIFR
jgi:heat shock protein HslJ